VAATAAATSLSPAIGRPPITIGLASTGSGIAAGTPPKASAAAPRTSAPSPRVTMITEISGWPTRRRRTTRLKATPRPAMPAQPTASAPSRPSPSAWSPNVTKREASITHSPTAKLIMREAR